jgi:carboxymethylenebutenolidase
MRRTRTLRRSWSIVSIAVVAGLLLLASVTAAEPAKEKEEAFTTDIIKVGSKDVRVERFEPKADGKKHPAIVILPGVDGMAKPFGPKYRDEAKRYAAKGYVMLIVHYLDSTDTSKEKLADIQERFRHFFNPTKEKNPAQLRGMGNQFVEWTNTVKKTVEYAGKLPTVDQKRVGLAGFSLGAALGLMAANEMNGQVAAVAELFGALPEDKVKGLKRLPPTLMMHGDIDERVPPKMAYLLEKDLKAKKCPVDLKMYQRVGHFFDEATITDFLDARSRIDAFFKKHLQDAGGKNVGK